MRFGKRKYSKESLKRVRLNYDDNLIFDCEPEKETMAVIDKIQQLVVVNKSVWIEPGRSIEIVAAELIDSGSGGVISSRLFPRAVILGKKDSLEIEFNFNATGPVTGQVSVSA